MPKFIGAGVNLEVLDADDQREVVAVKMNQVRALRKALGRKPRGCFTVNTSDKGGPRTLAKRWYERYVVVEDLVAALPALRKGTRIYGMALAECAK